MDFQEAKEAKKDEFYTQIVDIEEEISYYLEHLHGKTVYLNCDDYTKSNFFKYFFKNFKQLGISRLICSFHNKNNPESSYWVDVKHEEASDISLVIPNVFENSGDFREKESIELLKQADIVITNPPFSLFRQFIAQLFEYDKKFIVMGNMNALTYKEIFPLFKDDKMWYGPSIHSGDREFEVPDNYPLTSASFRIEKNGKRFVRVKGVRWFTNMDHAQRHDELKLTCRYSPQLYPKYANFDAIEVGATALIPVDYEGLMGVPISFMDKYNPDQFEIIGSSQNLGRPMSDIAAKGSYQSGGPRFYLADSSGKYRRLYDRIVIRRRCERNSGTTQ